MLFLFSYFQSEIDLGRHFRELDFEPVKVFFVFVSCKPFHFAALIGRIEDLSENDFSPVAGDCFKSGDDLKNRFRNPVPGNQDRFFDFYKFTFIRVIPSLRSVHHKAPSAARSQIEFVKCVGKAGRSPPVF